MTEVHSPQNTRRIALRGNVTIVKLEPVNTGNELVMVLGKKIAVIISKSANAVTLTII